MENSELNDKSSLPMGSSSQGATTSSMGDASKAALKSGYFKADEYSDHEYRFDDMMMPRGGVCGRPEGWAR
jgi:hypothetical protein